MLAFNLFMIIIVIVFSKKLWYFHLFQRFLILNLTFIIFVLYCLSYIFRKVRLF